MWKITATICKISGDICLGQAIFVAIFSTNIPHLRYHCISCYLPNFCMISRTPPKKLWNSIQSNVRVLSHSALGTDSPPHKYQITLTFGSLYDKTCSSAQAPFYALFVLCEILCRTHNSTFLLQTSSVTTKFNLGLVTRWSQPQSSQHACYKCVHIR